MNLEQDISKPSPIEDLLLFKSGEFSSINKVLESSVNKIYLPDGIYVDPSLDRIRDLEEIRVDRSSQVVLSGGSAHKVSFLNLYYRNHNGEYSIPVASKFYSQNQSGAKELLKMRKVSSLGISVFPPLMFLKYQDHAYLFTKTNFSVVSLDRYNWGDLYDESSNNHDTSKAMLEGIAKSLSKIHSLKICHGDSQLKNFVVDLKGKVKIVDWEASVFRKNMNIEELAVKDLSILYKSCIGLYENATNSLFKGKSISSWNMFKYLIIEPYIISLMYMGVKLDKDFEDKLISNMKTVLSVSF